MVMMMIMTSICVYIYIYNLKYVKHYSKHFIYVKLLVWGVLVAHLCPTLCDPMGRSPQGFSVRGILQARILEWVAISSSRGSSQPRDSTHNSCVSCIGKWFFTTEPPGKPIKLFYPQQCYKIYIIIISISLMRKLGHREVQ